MSSTSGGCSDRYGREHAYVRVKRAKGKEGQKQSDVNYNAGLLTKYKYIVSNLYSNRSFQNDTTETS
jgi:hypothetical protein